jgi:hypothetical protein
MENPLVTRCQGTTKKGTQCSKAAQTGSDFCGQHGPLDTGGRGKLAPEILQAAAELNDPAAEKAAKAKARREKKIIAKRGKLPEITPIKSGDTLVSAKGAARKARKAARRNKARSAEWAAARGAELARARAKEARGRFRNPETIARAARRVERREAGIKARAEAAS